MKLTRRLAPHVRSSVSNRAIMGDAVVTLAALYCMAYFYYGPRALVLAGVSVATCVLADNFCTLLRRRRVNIMDSSAVVTGLLLPLLMPASVPYKIVVTAALFAILVVKQPLGGVGSNLFNPAAGGFAFAIVCWSKELFSDPMPFAQLPLWGELTEPLYSSAAYTLYVGGLPQMGLEKLLLGQAPGPMGTTNLLVLAACLLYLVLRRTVRIQQPFFMLAAVALVAFLFPRAPVTGWDSVFYEIVAAPTLFFVTFMFSDPVTTPSRGSAKALYAVVAGVVLMLFRHVGGYEMTEPFALLLMNGLTPAFDAGAEVVNTLVRRATLETETVAEEPSITDDEEE